MWAVMASSTDARVRVYVRLLGEGTVVFKPVSARPITPSVVELVIPEDYDPDDEEWEFQPGATVYVEQRELEGEQALVAVEVISTEAFLGRSDKTDDSD